MLTARHPAPQSADGGAYALSPAVVLLAVDDGSARLFDLDGAFYALTESAAEMLQGALAHGIDATVVRLAERYAVAPGRIRSDIEALFDDLARRRLIERTGARKRRGRLRRLSARAVIGPVLRCLALFAASERLMVVTLIGFARVCTAMFGWGPTVEAWRAAIRPQASRSSAEDMIERIDGAIRRTAEKIPSVACKERALACWYLLCSKGIPATLVMGVQLYPMAGHCWCQVGDRVLTDYARRCAAFVPIVRYESGAELSAPASRSA